MRAVVIAGVALAALGGCRDESTFVGRDLSSATLYCPSEPPADRSYACDPTAIPFCTFPQLQVTCYCRADAGGAYALECPADMGGAGQD